MRPSLLANCLLVLATESSLPLTPPPHPFSPLRLLSFKESDVRGTGIQIAAYQRRKSSSCRSICGPKRHIVVKSVATPNPLVELLLTAENVELVLDEVRPYLIADGGNVVLHEIDGNVRLKLQGECGSCPSSVMTMKMGI